MKSVISKEKMEYAYKFSIIMSVYNVEEYIEDAVESILQQDIGFENNIQIIFVDDGSTDNSGKICDKYKEIYPNNIVVIHKKNGGLSSARNEGLKYVKGEYINFFDPDDILTLNTLSLVYDFFSQYREDIDIIAIPLVFFEGKTGEHPTNSTKFKKGSRIIDLTKECFLIQTSCAASFIKSELAKKIHFDENLHSMEDAKALVEILIHNSKYGVVSGCQYNYRKRLGLSGSLSQGASRKKRWYIDQLNNFGLDVIRICITQIGYVPRFVQYTIMYDLQWKLTQKRIPKGILSTNEIDIYKRLITEILSYINDDIILSQKNMYTEHKLYALSKKYPEYTTVEWRKDDLCYKVKDYTLSTLSSMTLRIDFLELREKQLFIEGSIYQYVINDNYLDLCVCIKLDANIIECDNVSRVNNQYIMDEKIMQGINFKINVALENDCHNICFFIKGNNRFIEIKKIQFNRYSTLGNKYSSEYISNKYYLLSCKKNMIEVKKTSTLKSVKAEMKFVIDLFMQKNVAARKAGVVRIILLFLKKFKRKKVWLISDKANRADDNGEALFKFLTKNKQIKVYFILNKDYQDYYRLKQYGKVIDLLSWRHKFLFLLADRNISAYAHPEILNPFGSRLEFYRQYINMTPFIFLQHGITQNDVSEALNKYNKNISLLFTSAKEEYDYFLKNPNFYYDEKIVKLSGFPRYDYLYNEPQKIITIAPTWRSFLFEGFVEKEDRWILKPNFRKTDFYKFYMRIVNNERLLSKASELGYRIQFFPHSIFFPYIKEFQVDERVILSGTELSYRKMFAETDLLVTDYSSIAFDFVYLKKPVIYAQFDFDEFFTAENSYRTGYFDYEEKGFGEVVHTPEETVDMIINYMENECKIKHVYQNRIDDFFAYSDTNNCKRVYEEIKDMDK